LTGRIILNPEKVVKPEIVVPEMTIFYNCPGEGDIL
jgi:hypothetical protein